MPENTPQKAKPAQNAINPRRAEDFPEWYKAVVNAAETESPSATWLNVARSSLLSGSTLWSAHNSRERSRPLPALMARAIRNRASGSCC